nr:MAG TPA: hypothetical protein [Caudoviricetes sp.]
MTDFKTELIALLEREIPELRDKIQAGAVDERTAVPFAAFSTPDETPVRTMNGIAGYVTTFEVAVYEQKTSALEKLKHRIIAALEGQVLTDRRCSFKSSSTEYYPDYDIHGVTLTFRIV